MKRELPVWTVVLLCAIAALALLGGSVLWTRPFWMDEIAMVFLTSESSPVEMIRILSRGGDWNPPTLHLIVWTFMRVTGTDVLTPVWLRTFSLVCVSLALLFVYVVLRRRFGRLPSAAGVLAVAAQGLVITHAFEGRFYGPWLLFAAAVAWALGLDAGADRSRRRDVLVAITSVLLTTIHWYGVFSLGLIWLGVGIAWRSRLRDAFRLIAPSLVGVVVLLLHAPIAIAQRASAAPVLWVHPLSLAQVDQVTRQFIPGALVVILAIALVLDLVTRAHVSAELDVARVRADATADAMIPLATNRADVSVPALLALAAMPLVLVLLSVVLTPSMVFRYAIVATLAWGPVVAFIASGGSRVSRVALLAGVALFLLFQVRAQVHEQTQVTNAIAFNRRAYERAKQDSVPIVFQRLHVIYPVAGVERSPTTLARYIDVSDTTLDAMYPQPEAASVRASFRLDRDQARYHQGIYGWPIMAPVEELNRLPRFYVVAADATLPPGYSPITRYGARLFPNHRARRMGGALTLFERATP